MTEIQLRDIETDADIEACIDLQRRTWGMPETDLTPARIFIVARHAGIAPIGAFDGTGRLVGFVHTIHGRFAGHPAFYSHMLAVDPTLRDTGIGYRLKLAQRERALEQNVPVVVWTFDPLQSRNAHFNLNKLGAIVRRYIVNFYGQDHRSLFDAGIGSDRLFAEWWVGSRHVADALERRLQAPTAPSVTVEIPADINSVKRRDGGDALVWRLRVRQEFQSILSRDLATIGLRHDRSAGMSTYVFARASEVALGD